MEQLMILFLGIALGGMISNWLSGRKIDKHLDSNKWLFVANVYRNNVLTGYQTGVMTVFDPSSSTPTQITNHIVKEANKLGNDVDDASLVVFERLPK